MSHFYSDSNKRTCVARFGHKTRDMFELMLLILLCVWQNSMQDMFNAYQVTLLPKELLNKFIVLMQLQNVHICNCYDCIFKISSTLDNKTVLVTNPTTTIKVFKIGKRVLCQIR